MCFLKALEAFFICFVSQVVEQDAKKAIKNIIPSGRYECFNLAHNTITSNRDI